MGGILTVVVVVLAGIWLAGWGIRRGLAAARVPESQDPGSFGLRFNEVSISTAKGKSLFGWFVPAASAECTPAFAILHGWGGNAEMMLPVAKPLHEAGYSVLLFDARCHGRSDEDDFASLPRFAEDAGHAVDWLGQQAGVDASRICLFGHSVGAGAMLLLATRRADISVVVSLAAFAHPATTMRRWLAAKRMPYWPLGWGVSRYVEHAIGHRFDDIAPQHTIASVRCPTLLLHGSEDETVPLTDAHAIYAARSGDHVQLRIIAGSHDDYRDLDLEIPTLLDFLGTATRSGYHDAHLHDAGAHRPC
jgi:uncharacterized protein